MKYSKVGIKNETKMGTSSVAVGDYGNGQIGGMLYSRSGKENGSGVLLPSNRNDEGNYVYLPDEETKNEHFQKLDRSAKILYNLFSPIQAATPPTEPIKPEEAEDEYEQKLNSYNYKLDNYNTKLNNYELRKTYEVFVTRVNKLAKDIIKYDKLTVCDNNGEKDIKDFDSILSRLSNKGKSLDRHINLGGFVVLVLRDSLCKNMEGAKCFLRNIGKMDISDDDKKLIKEFLVAVYYDYHGRSEVHQLGTDGIMRSVIRDYNALTIKSIVNQGLVIKIVGEKFVISQSGTYDQTNQEKRSRKCIEKEALQKYLVNYASLDKGKRLDMLRRLRRLIDLYFSTPEDWKKGDSVINIEDWLGNDNEATVDVSEFDVWKRHDLGKQKSGTFVVIPDKLKEFVQNKKALPALDKKSNMNDLKKRIRNRNMICYRYACYVVDVDGNREGGTVFFQEQAINQFWLHHIENAVERILSTENLLDTMYFKLNNAYLSEKIWKDALNLISIKYIATGKAVYHFGIQELVDNIVAGKEKIDCISLGRVSERINCINSFDYEYIKAGEVLQRELAVFVAFAINNLARATVDIQKAVDTRVKQKEAEKDKKKRDKIRTEMEDLFLWNENDIKQFSKVGDMTEPNVDKNQQLLTLILQFFGGRSRWTSFEEFNKEDFNTCSFLNDLKNIVYNLRNESFHFTTLARNSQKWKTDLIGRMFEQEAMRCVSNEKNKFYSNNLWRYYECNDLEKMPNLLYKETHSRASQVPAFAHVVVRSKFSEFLVDDLRWMVPVGVEWDADELDEWRHGLYYLMKEIYYNVFIHDPESKNIFNAIVSEWNTNAVNTIRTAVNERRTRSVSTISKQEETDARAAKSFGERIDNIIKTNSNVGLSDICQIIMTDYNQQNQNKRKAKSCYDSIFDEEIYQHYKLLLIKALRVSFAKYLNEKIRSEDNTELFGFLKEPKAQKNISLEEFLPEWNSEKFKPLIDKVKAPSNDQATNEAKELQIWYVVGRLLSPRLLNLMVGSMRSYLQYTSDVKRRAGITNNNVHVNTAQWEKVIEQAIPVIDMCIQLSSNFTKEFSDYFIGEPEEEYAQYLYRYLKFDKSDDQSYSDALRSFCNKLVFPVGIYWDGQNPIPNRNILMAKLYGPDSVLEKIEEPVSKEDIENYQKARESIEEYRKSGKCTTEALQKNILQYQRIKNHVELWKLVDDGELMNALLGQLINWSFLRERDLLYFQLGFHYICFNNQEVKPKSYQKLQVSKRNNKMEVDGAILYNILGMYINGVGVLVPNRNPEYKEEQVIGGAGGKISSFLKYAKNMMNSDEALKLYYAGKTVSGSEDEIEKERAEDLYNAGLEVFEVVSEHDNITDVRNIIDHFKYYDGKNGSILDLYSEVFDRFFTYDMKYQKGVPNLLYNIILKNAKTAITIASGTGTKKVGSREENEQVKERAQLKITGINSEKFTFNNVLRQNEENGEQDKGLKLDAKDQSYLEKIVKILYYPNEAPKNLVKKRNTTENKKEVQKQEKKEYNNNVKNSNNKNNATKNKNVNNKVNNKKVNNYNGQRNYEQKEKSDGYFLFRDAISKLNITESDN